MTEKTMGGQGRKVIALPIDPPTCAYGYYLQNESTMAFRLGEWPLAALIFNRHTPPMRSLLYIFFACVLAVSAQAQILFTFQGTVTSSPVAEYTVGDTVTFTLLTHPSIDPNGWFTPGEGGSYDWVEELDSDPVIYSSVNFTGATGQWARPHSSVTAEGPETYIGLYADIRGTGPWFYTNFGSDLEGPGSSTGLFVGTNEVYYVLIQGDINLTPDFSAATPNLIDYFSQYPGHYTLSTDTSYIKFTDLREVELSITDMTVTIVPESATAPALAGIAALGALALIRRRRA